MSDSGVILHKNPDWLAIRLQSNETAAASVTSILKSMDLTEKQVYARRGMACLLAEERQLFRWVIDEEVGDYFVSFDRWLKQTCPESWSYCRQAMNAVKELKDMKFEDLLQIKRANIEQLKKVSSNVRLLPEVVQAAKHLPEKQFVEKLNTEHQQHLDVKTPIVMATPDDCEEFETAIAMAIAVEGCANRAEAIRCISVNYIQEHAVEAEHRQETA
jgi:hypothetical protein